VVIMCHCSGTIALLLFLRDRLGLGHFNILQLNPFRSFLWTHL
jgi:hypothetical protein